MNRLRAGQVLVVVGLVLAGLLAVLAARPADAARYDGPVVAVGAADFTAQPDSPAFAVDTLDPGRSVSTVLGVRTAGTEPGRLTVRLDGVESGPYAAALAFTVATGPGRDGPFRTVWRGGAEGFAQGVDTGTTVVSGTDRWLRLTAAMPWSAGNEVAHQRYPFGLVIALADNAGVDAVQVGPQAHDRHDTDAVDAYRTGSKGSNVLASTGSTGLGLVALAISCLVAGGALVLVGRRRRASAQGG